MPSNIDWRQKLRDITSSFAEQSDLDIANLEQIRENKREKQRQAQAASLKSAEEGMQARISESQTRATQQYQATMSDLQNRFANLPRYTAAPNNMGAISAAPAKTGVAYTGSSRSALNSLKPGANLTTISTRAGRVTVNKQYAQQFAGFIQALGGIYNISSLGGYANRNIAGSSSKSLHAYGLAIDINPGANPVTHGKVKTNLPPNIAELAARYGLTWGGAWRGSKKDPMHFSVKGYGE